MNRFMAFYCILIWSNIGCSIFTNTTTQYIVIKKGGRLQPYAKIEYNVFVDRQEVVYWVTIPGKKRSQLYKLSQCIVADKDNWEGETHFSDQNPLPAKVEYTNGKFKNSNNVSWWTWHFETDPKPSNLALISGGCILIMIFIGILMAMYDEIHKWRAKRGN